MAEERLEYIINDFEVLTGIKPKINILVDTRYCEVVNLEYDDFVVTVYKDIRDDKYHIAGITTEQGQDIFSEYMKIESSYN